MPGAYKVEHVSSLEVFGELFKLYCIHWERIDCTFDVDDAVVRTEDTDIVVLESKCLAEQLEKCPYVVVRRLRKLSMPPNTGAGPRQ